LVIPVARNQNQNNTEELEKSGIINAINFPRFNKEIEQSN
jgi:hypothetical protein